MDDEDRIGKEITISFTVDDDIYDAGTQAVLDALVEREKAKRSEGMNSDAQALAAVLFRAIITDAEFTFGNGDPKLGVEKVDRIMDEGMRKWREKQQNDGDGLFPDITP